MRLYVCAVCVYCAVAAKAGGGARFILSEAGVVVLGAQNKYCPTGFRFVV